MPRMILWNQDEKIYLIEKCGHLPPSLKKMLIVVTNRIAGVGWGERG